MCKLFKRSGDVSFCLINDYKTCHFVCAQARDIVLGTKQPISPRLNNVYTACIAIVRKQCHLASKHMNIRTSSFSHPFEPTQTNATNHHSPAYYHDLHLRADSVQPGFFCKDKERDG